MKSIQVFMIYIVSKVIGMLRLYQEYLYTWILNFLKSQKTPNNIKPSKVAKPDILFCRLPFKF